jgi:hypothetical protein
LTEIASGHVFVLIALNQAVHDTTNLDHYRIALDAC